MFGLMLAFCGFVFHGACKLDLEVESDCSAGQCDIFSDIRELLQDARNVDLNDMITAGLGLFTDEMNDAMEFIEVQESVAYALEEDHIDDIAVESLDLLVSGLVTRFGREELTRDVTQLRIEHLENSSDRYFVESAFALHGDAYWNWALATEGFGFGDAEKRERFLGISTGGEIQARVIGAYQGEIAGIMRAPLGAIRAARGFIFPRGIDDLRGMSPGEAVAFSGQGHLGLNVGAGVPIFIADPTPAISFSLVLSVALRTLLEGKLDVQLVKMRNQELVVDVGMENAAVAEAEVAITPGWGVEGLVKSTVNIKSVELDIGRIIDKGVKKRLEKKIKTLEVQFSREKEKTRLTVARFRFRLDELDDRGIHALERASRGDIRLAQNLAARGDQGINVEFDLDRTGVSTSSYKGVNLFGLNFFDHKIENSGAAVLQTPGGARTLVWDGLGRFQGSGFPSHGFKRTGVTGLTFAEHGVLGEGEANLFLETKESDRFMERSRMLGQVDPMLMALLGVDVFKQVQASLEPLAAYLHQKCPLGGHEDSFSESCNIEAIELDNEFSALRENVWTLFWNIYASLESDSSEDSTLADLAAHLMLLKVGIHSVQDPLGFLHGPSASIDADFRLDDGALDALMGRSRQEFQEVLHRTLDLVKNNRRDFDFHSPTQPTEPFTDAIAAMGSVFARRSAQYRDYKWAEKGLLNKEFKTPGYSGKHAEILEFATIDNRPNYESATMSSMAQFRSESAVKMFDELYNLSDASAAPNHAEQWISFAFLNALPRHHINLKVGFFVDTEGLLNGQLNPRFRYDAAQIRSFDVQGRGRLVEPLFDGLFDIDQVINLQDE